MPDPTIEGFNPCAEIGLADGESCNLATIFLPNVETRGQFTELSKLLYKVQKAIAAMDYPYEKTNRIVRKNMRLGQSITGVLQASPTQLSWLRDSYDTLRQFDTLYSAKKGLPLSVRLTTVQPSGTLSLLPGVTPGIHPAFARFYIRRVRFGVNDPLVEKCRKRGYPVCFDVGIDGREDHSRYVVSFPCKSPDNAVLAADMTAIEQLEWVKRMQTDWADNAVSVTVYYRLEELDAIKEWLATNYDDSIKSVSFLLHADHNFPLPPYEEVTEAEYEKMLRSIDLTVPMVDTYADGELFDDCAGGACPVR
jgi:ribonucleotide reductase alpha subunit